MSTHKRDAPPAPSAVQKAERAVISAAVGCVNKQGHAFTLDTESAARFFIINERALRRLERAVANLKEARRKRGR